MFVNSQLAYNFDPLKQAVYEGAELALRDAVADFVKVGSQQVMHAGATLQAVEVDNREWEVQVRARTEEETAGRGGELKQNLIRFGTPGAGTAVVAGQVNLIPVTVIGARSIKKKTITGEKILEMLGEKPMEIALDTFTFSYLTYVKTLAEMVVQWSGYKKVD